MFPDVGDKEPHGPNLVWGGGGTVLVCLTDLLTQYTTTHIQLCSRFYQSLF